MKRYIAAVLTLTLLAFFCFQVPVTYADEIQNGDETMLSANIESAECTYADYIGQYSDIKALPSSARKQLNVIIKEGENTKFEVDIPADGLYAFGMSYRALDKKMSKMQIGIMIDGSYPYSEARNFEVPRMWCDENNKNRTDSFGNEYAAQQVLYQNYYFDYIYDYSADYFTKYKVYLKKGTHSVMVSSVEGILEIEYFEFSVEEEIKNYSKPGDTDKHYKGSRIEIEGEAAKVKSSYYLVGKTDASTVNVSPNNYARNVVNYIGGGNWKSIGDTIIWETPYLQEGYYQIGFSYRQNTVIGGKTYRILKIDGKVPFAEAEAVGFKYGDNWQKFYFADGSKNPYLIYFSEGKHTISLTVTAGEVAKVRELLRDSVSMLGDLYVDIIMITGENVDVYRDYQLFSQIPNMEERLTEVKDRLNAAGELLLEINGQDSGSHYSVIRNMIEVIDKMLKNKFDSHRYKNYYYSNYCSVSAVLEEICDMPLDIDRIVLAAPGEEKVVETKGILTRIAYSTMRFLNSFVRDYTAVSVSKDSNTKSITVWVNWGRDQAQVLSSLINSSFTPMTGVSVNLHLVNASLVQATLSGNGPDCFLQHSRSEPVNLAMRGVLYDLSTFDDCNEVLKRFQKGAETPYRYKGGLYALPDTQSFFMMFYRKDILSKFNIPIPSTWDEFDEAAKLLMRNNMSVWLPNNVATDTAQINAGVGSNNIFPSLLLQNGVSLYAEDGKSTNLLSADAMEVFSKWTDYYRKMKFPLSLNFYNRFRTGTTPLGIASYTLYTTLKVAASEIDGLWGMTAIPGTVQPDGSISHASSGSGTGCGILKSTKNIEASWEFIKWWTSTETQSSFSNNVESIIGPAGRVALSNVEAIKSLAWDEGMLDELLNAWSHVEEIPEYPGSYYVSRSIYQSFWNVVNANQNTKEMLMKFGIEADAEIAQKWKQYSNR